MNYFFGRKEETNGYAKLDGVWIEADTLEFAIYKFAYTEDNIYKYLSDYSLSEYNCDLNKYILKDASYDKAEINVYTEINEDYKLVKTIKISELENFNFDDVEHDLFHAQNIFNDEYITPTFIEYVQKLEKENTELKKGLSVVNASNSFNKEQLNEAKEIIKELVRVEYADFTNGDYSNELSKVLERAEQFLKE